MGRMALVGFVVRNGWKALGKRFLKPASASARAILNPFSFFYLGFAPIPLVRERRDVLIRIVIGGS